LDHRTLKDYCVTEESKGKVLYTIRRVVINDLIKPLKTFAMVVFLGSAAMKLPLRGRQTVLEFKQSLAIYLSVRNISLISLMSWYANSNVDEDGRLPLDNRALSHYGWDTSHTGVVLYVGCKVFNQFDGTATILYGNGIVENNIPFLEAQTVLQFKEFLSQVTKIPTNEQIIFVYPENDTQNADGGVWKTIKHYLTTI